MRIIGGMAAGTRLQAPKGRGIRPTSDRVKEALFSALGDIVGWTVVDLYSGTGALGLEAWSRGAEQVALVDHDSQAFRTVRENLARALRTASRHISPEPTIFKCDVASAATVLADMAGTIDLILADPPYHPGPKDFGAEKMMLDPGISEWARGALLAVEHETGTQLPWHPQSAWSLLKQRRYGSRTISYARCEPQPAPAQS